MSAALKSITLEGFKSIRELKDFELSSLNVIIGANGAGKSNFIQLFKMLQVMSQKNFSKYIQEHGGADSFLYNGPKQTSSIKAEFEFLSNSPYAEGSNSYRFILTPTVNETFLIEEERKYYNTNWRSYGNPSDESKLHDMRDETAANGNSNGVGHYVYHSISDWMVYHFHDTSEKAPMRRSEIVEDNLKLRSDAANIAPFLLRLREISRWQSYYRDIVQAIRLVMPFFDDFRLDTVKMGESEKTRLSWQQKGSDFPMQPYHLSDGSIRFIALATALLQPVPPSTMIIDEPELGLHPEAIAILAELMHSMAKRTQLIVATQSPILINHFSVNNLIVANRNNRQTCFERLNEVDFSEWLKDYNIGELWVKNVINGGTNHE
nr:AAA family ATPase [Desulfobulbaceae bacterium]